MYLPLKLNLYTELGVHCKDERVNLQRLCIVFDLQCHFVIKLNLVVDFNSVIFLRIKKDTKNHEINISWKE